MRTLSYCVIVYEFPTPPRVELEEEMPGLCLQLFRQSWSFPVQPGGPSPLALRIPLAVGPAEASPRLPTYLEKTSPTLDRRSPLPASVQARTVDPTLPNATTDLGQQAAVLCRPPRVKAGRAKKYTLRLGSTPREDSRANIDSWGNQH